MKSGKIGSVLRNPKIANSFLAVCLVAGLVAGPLCTVHREYGKAEKLFYKGAQGDGVGVSSDLSDQIAAAANLAVIGSRYEETAALAAGAKQAAQQAAEAKDIGQKTLLTQQAGEQMERLGAALENCTLSEEDDRYRMSLADAYAAAADRMKRDPYNKAALSFDTLRKKFPASLAAGLLGAEELPVFE